jgi:4-hydroxy-2-oxoheptanedioate aldolase
MREVWNSGGTALGAWLFLREPLVAEAAALAGYDYVCIDMQHGLQSFEHTVTMLYAMARTETTPIVRVPWNEPGIIGRVLDAGAEGVVIPMVNTADDARAAVRACFYGPKGARSMGPVGVSARAGREGYFGAANNKVLCIPMIETKEAVANLDEILTVPGIDAVYVGPADLSITLGLKPGNNDGIPAFDDALATIVAGCRKAGIVPGCHATAALVERRLEQGFRMITVSSDSLAMRSSLVADLTTARGAQPAAGKSAAMY